MILSGSIDGRPPSGPWRHHLEKPSRHNATDDVSTKDLFQSILDDVQYYPTSIIKSACTSLQELLTSARVASRLVRSLDTARQAPQLHAGLKLLLDWLQLSEKPSILGWSVGMHCVSRLPPPCVIFFLSHIV